MSHFNWPLFVCLMVLLMPVSILRIWHAVTFDRRVEKRAWQMRDRQWRMEQAMDARRLEAAEDSRRTGVAVCERCHLRPVAGAGNSMCESCGI